MVNTLVSNGVAIFEKVSLDVFMDGRRSVGITNSVEEEAKCLDEMSVPRRSTHGSAGYDFYSPSRFVLKPGEEVTIHTGIRAKFYREDFALFLFPRSGSSFSHGIRIVNTVGVVDSDYYYSDNEGQIVIKLSLPRYFNGKENFLFVIEKGDRFCQGIFLPYGLTINDGDFDKTTRNGGFGSTSK